MSRKSEPTTARHARAAQLVSRRVVETRTLSELYLKMDALKTLLQYEIWSLLIGLALIIAYRLLTRRINTRGLLQDKAGSRGFSPGRLQLFVVIVASAFYYLMLTFSNPKTDEMPVLSDELLLVLGGSNVVYLGGKLLTALPDMFNLSALFNRRAR